ncbi:MAG TPA: hypothetical protein VEI97_00755 [bacterium]|nr:hypothetical protein [bacterium]
MQTEIAAGRELDARVAEKVMGEDVAEQPRHPYLYPCDTDRYNGFRCGRCRRKVPEATWHDYQIQKFGPCRPKPAHYSTDIAAAMEVVAHLAQEHDVEIELSRDLAICIIYYRDYNYESEDHYFKDEWGYGSADSDQLPLAICRAALDAQSKPPPFLSHR